MRHFVQFMLALLTSCVPALASDAGNLADLGLGYAGGGSAGTTINGAVTKGNIAVADGTAWNSKVVGGDLLMTSVDGSFKVVGMQGFPWGGDPPNTGYIPVGNTSGPYADWVLLGKDAFIDQIGNLTLTKTSVARSDIGLGTTDLVQFSGVTSTGTTYTQTLTATGASTLAAVTATSIADSGTLSATGAASLFGGLTVTDPTDTTKKVTWAANSASTGTTLTLNDQQTTSQTLFYPNITGADTLVTRASSQTLSGSSTFSAVTTVTNTTSAASSTVGAFIVGNNTTATTVAIGGGTVFAGTNVSCNSTLGGNVVQTNTQVLTGTTDSSSVSTGTSHSTGGMGVAKRSFLGTIGTTFSGNVFAGAQDGTAAVAGQVGEVLSATSSSYTNYTTNVTYQQLATMSVTQGQWEVFVTVNTSGNGATLTTTGNFIVALATATASATGAVEGDTLVYANEPLITMAKNTITLHTIIAPTATTSYYLNSQAAFSAGNPQFTYSLRFVRYR